MSTSVGLRPQRAAARWPQVTPPHRLLAVLVAFVAATLVLIGAYWLLPDLPSSSIAFAASRILSTVAFAAGALTSRRGFRQDWLLMTGAIAVWAGGDLTAAIRVYTHGMVGDWRLEGMGSLVAFALMGVGVLRLAHRDGFVAGAAVTLDAAVYVVAVALLWWVMVGQQVLAHHQAHPSEVLLASIGPFGDALLLAAATAIISSRNAHALSSRALVLMAAAALVGDLGFGRSVSGPEQVLPHWVPAVWMAQFALAAVAALSSGLVAEDSRSRLSALGVTLTTFAMGGPLVATVLRSYRGDEPLHPATLPVVLTGTLAMILLVSYRVLLVVRQLESQAEELVTTARTDELTSLPNRRAGRHLLEDAIDEARAQGRPLAVALLDLDHFKAYNDAHGHQGGDRLLQEAGRSWTAALGDRGLVYRYGGEEFVVVLPGHTLADAEPLLDAMRLATPLGETFSAGLAELRAGDDAQRLVGRADAALYAAKAAGRDRTTASA
ncbi:GGDEF domain-containing protein [Arsenicicoccus dermatophilus]|uniref:GGDEF domain-containing protein n=1 Tax=Arsenicicoccus dermatophilus TaxID=1076331 RepID=UPI001F4D111A|nr:GGDEF domain-containing protein [Arsenicicoccus dermatophilus]